MFSISACVPPDAGVYFQKLCWIVSAKLFVRKYFAATMNCKREFNFFNNLNLEFLLTLYNTWYFFRVASMYLLFGIMMTIKFLLYLYLEVIHHQARASTFYIFDFFRCISCLTIFSEKNNFQFKQYLNLFGTSIVRIFLLIFII